MTDEELNTELMEFFWTKSHLKEAKLLREYHKTPNTESHTRLINHANDRFLRDKLNQSGLLEDYLSIKKSLLKNHPDTPRTRCEAAYLAIKLSAKKPPHADE
jgi:hypothetical protein